MNSVSGRHGNLPDKDHRWIVRRGFRNNNNLLLLKSFCLSFTICDCLDPDHAKYPKTFFTYRFSSIPLKNNKNKNRYCILFEENRATTAEKSTDEAAGVCLIMTQVEVAGL